MEEYIRSGLGSLSGGIAAIGATALMGTTMLTAPAAAQTAEELKAQIDKLQQQVDQLSQQQVAASPVQAVVGGDKPRTYKLPGTDTSLQFGGYVKGDLIYDVKSQNGDSFAVSGIPLDGVVSGTGATATRPDEQEGHVRFHARQSRVWFKSWTPTDLGEVRTHIEGDFFGDGGNETFSNSTTFRLRHAYGTLGGLLIGQTWTNFMSLHAYPETIDFFGPTGMPFARQGQIRYTFTPSPGLAVSVSAENPETDGRVDGSATAFVDESRGGIAFDEYPDFTAAVKYSGEMFTVSAAAVGRFLTIDNGLGGAADVDEEEFGWGLRASASADLVGGRLNVVANVHGGDGIGRYMLTSGRALVLEADGDIETVTQWGTTVGAGWKWTDFLRSSIGWGHVEIDDDDLAVSTLPEQQDTVHLNLIWAPVPRVWIGIEGIYGRIKVDDNPAGDDDNDQFRIQIGSRFNF